MPATPSKHPTVAVGMSPSSAEWSEMEEGHRSRALSIISMEEWTINSRAASPVKKAIGVGECLWEVMMMGMVVEWLIVCEWLEWISA